MEISPMPQVATVTDLRYRPNKVLDRTGKDAVMVTKNGHPIVVIVSIEHWNEISGLFHLLRTPQGGEDEST